MRVVGEQVVREQVVGGGGGGRRRAGESAQPKPRTPHKDVRKKTTHLQLNCI